MNIYNDNCLRKLGDLPKNSINLYIIDLVNNEYNLGKLWKKIKYSSKNDATILFFCNTRIGYELIKSNEEWFDDDLIYMKNEKEYENIYIFKKPFIEVNYEVKYDINSNIQYTIYEGMNDFPDNIIPTYLSPLDIGDNIIDNIDINDIKQEVSDNIDFSVYKKGIKSILDFKTFKSDTKPVSLLEYLIKKYTNKDDLVICLDMDKGNSAIACINTERKYIGIEEDVNKYRMVQRRLNNYHRIYK